MNKTIQNRVRYIPHKHRIVAVLTTEILIGTLLSIGSFLLFYIFVYSFGSNIFVQLDTQISEVIYSFRSPLLTTFMRFITSIGNEFIIMAMIVAPGVFWIRKRLHDGIFFVFSVGMGFAINLIIKAIIQRPRPEIDPLYQELFYSFPSGHAMNSFIFYSIIVFFIYHFTHNKMITLYTGVIASVIIIAIGVSRVYLGVHYPSDVIAGFIAGFWWVCTVLVIERTLRYFRIVRPHVHT